MSLTATLPHRRELQTPALSSSTGLPLRFLAQGQALIIWNTIFAMISI